MPVQEAGIPEGQPATQQGAHACLSLWTICHTRKYARYSTAQLEDFYNAALAAAVIVCLSRIHTCARRDIRVPLW